MPIQKNMISTEEARIMLLEQRNDDFYQALIRIEKRIDSLGSNLESKIDRLESKVDSHFRWSRGLIFGLYATGFATLLGAVGKAHRWF